MLQSRDRHLPRRGLCFDLSRQARCFEHARPLVHNWPLSFGTSFANTLLWAQCEGFHRLEASSTSARARLNQPRHSTSLALLHSIPSSTLRNFTRQPVKGTLTSKSKLNVDSGARSQSWFSTGFLNLQPVAVLDSESSLTIPQPHHWRIRLVSPSHHCSIDAVRPQLAGDPTHLSKSTPLWNIQASSG